MLLMRVSLPRRPGALGAVATALGSLDADINLVEIVEKGPDFEIDEFILDLPASQTIEAIVAACDSLDGVEVQWIRNYPRGGGIDSDLELLRRMNADTLPGGRNARLRLPDRVSRAMGTCVGCVRRTTGHLRHSGGS